tara:strand:+ start:1025 stop:1447 length:423 start_codon:yes stop_codon:yes gene_type:complete
VITEKIQKEIIDNFNMLDDDIEMSLNYLMELGEGLEPMDEDLRVDDNIIKGCQSKVWLTHTFVDDKLHFLGDSNTAITKGLLSLLISVFNNRTPEEILDSKLFFINETGLCRFIGTQRSNGLEAMENKFKLIALNALKNG